MNTFKTALALAIATLALAACSKKESGKIDEAGPSTVYMTRDISPEGLVKAFKALGVEPQGAVAVKISTGEAGNTNYLKPELIKDLVEMTGGTIVECNTAYAGKRMTFEEHRQVIRDHGFEPLFKVDLMDEEGEMQIPVRDTTHIKYDIVGTHLANYDFMINLAHFKGHPMGGLGGVLKNASIGVASANGKANIHTAGYQQVVEGLWEHVENQDGFLESMAAAAQGVHDYFKQEGKNVVYICVMNNMSVDCDCVATPEDPKLADIGILASLDPVALDQACVDLVFGHENDREGDDAKPLQERINRQHGTHTIDYAEQIGLGSKEYELVDIDE
ncbi:MAG: DUF362 domain-containing protein [Prevotella sp.]|nr:DUF362 domain-containing protein [Prevotella sp.]